MKTSNKSKISKNKFENMQEDLSLLWRDFSHYLKSTSFEQEKFRVRIFNWVERLNAEEFKDTPDINKGTIFLGGGKGSEAQVVYLRMLFENALSILSGKQQGSIQESDSDIKHENYIQTKCMCATVNVILRALGFNKIKVTPKDWVCK